jgi:hypothetical protein
MGLNGVGLLKRVVQCMVEIACSVYWYFMSKQTVGNQLLGHDVQTLTRKVLLLVVSKD